MNYNITFAKSLIRPQSPEKDGLEDFITESTERYIKWTTVCNSANVDSCQDPGIGMRLNHTLLSLYIQL